MKILVTGAAGFIGSAVVELLRHDHEIRAIDNFSVGTIERIGDVAVEQMDVVVPSDVAEMVRGQDVVVHLAGYTGVPICEQQPEAAAIHMLVATKYVADTAVEAGVRQLLYASSFAVYGRPPRHVTEQTPRAPIGMYGVLKATCEHVLEAASRLNALDTVIFRQTNIYGKALTAKRTVVNLLTEQAIKREPMTIYGSGEQVRNFVHIWDVAHAYKLAIERGSSGVYNLGGAQNVSVREIADMVNAECERVLGYRVPVLTAASRGAGKHEIAATDFEVDTTKIRHELGFQPERTVRETIREMLAASSVEGAAPV